MRPKFHENRIICKYWYLHWHNYDTNISKLMPPPPELLTNASTFVVAFTFKILMWILLLGMLLWRRLLLLLLNSWIGGGYSVGASVAGPNQIGHSLIQSKFSSVNTFTSTRIRTILYCGYRMRTYLQQMTMMMYLETIIIVMNNHQASVENRGGFSGPFVASPNARHSFRFTHE